MANLLWRRFIVVDRPTTADDIILFFLEMIALGFVLEAVAALVRGELQTAAEALIAGAIIGYVGIKSPEIRQVASKHKRWAAAIAIFGIVAIGIIWARRPQVIPKGLRLQAISFSIPTAGETVSAVSVWDNTSDENLMAFNRSTVFTIGLAANEKPPFKRETELNAELYGWNEYHKTDTKSNTTQIEPHAKVVVRFHSDPNKPLDQFLVNEFKLARARVYVIGENGWSQNGEMHGCEFCQWSGANSVGNLCHGHNRCF
jgi:hypothetical protein